MSIQKPKKQKKINHPVSMQMWLCGDVNDEMLSNFFEFFSQIPDGKIPINIHISSGGGDVDSGIAMYDALRSLPNPIITYGYGTVGSIAVVIFCAGDERILTPNTMILIHPVSAEIGGNIHEVSGHVEGILIAQRKIVSIMTEACGGNVSLEEVEYLANKETFLSADESLYLKLATGITKFKERA